jgi:hypothetical protein
MCLGKDGPSKNPVIVKEQLCLKNVAKNAFWVRKNLSQFAKRTLAQYREKAYMPLMCVLVNIQAKLERENIRILHRVQKECYKRKAKSEKHKI